MTTIFNKHPSAYRTSSPRPAQIAALAIFLYTPKKAHCKKLFSFLPFCGMILAGF
jgi:hypothetical protein